MTLSEFDLITQYFDRHPSGAANAGGVKLGIGDDCAIVSVPAQHDLVMTVDTLVEGVHYSPLFSARQTGWFSLAVNLSDLASMGAVPAWFTLAITAPEADPDWFEGFSAGLFECADQYGITLIGGDTTKGARTISIQAHGVVPGDTALRRDGARPGDLVFVTGNPGAARAGLELLREEAQIDHPLVERLMRPLPRIEFGQRLRPLAHAAIDISDGLLADLGHILDRSRVGAVLSLEQLPVDQRVLQRFDITQAREFALCGGDDYELCFTLPQKHVATLETVAAETGVTVTHIGEINDGSELVLQDSSGEVVPWSTSGFQHFKGSTSE